MDLREFISNCDSDNDVAYPKELVDVDYEVAAYIRKSCDTDGPVLVMAPSNSGIRNRIVGSVYGSRRRIKRVFGLAQNCEDFDVVKEYFRCASVDESFELSSFTEDVYKPPCQDVVVVGDGVDLSVIPICKYNEYDSGRFITSGVNVVKWVDGATHGLGIHRMKVVEKNVLSCLAPPNRRVGYPHFASGSGVKMAVVIGAPPAVTLASQAKIPSTAEKYVVASRILGEKLRLTKCITSDVLVPADAELVIECTSIPGSLYDDSGFGEYSEVYSMRSNAWLCNVDAITYRKDYIFQALLTGATPNEDQNLCAVPMAAEIYRAARRVVEEITDVSVFLGNCVFDSIVCIKKSSNEQVANLIYTLLGNKYIKSISIMDSDMRANMVDWQFCFNTRYQPDRDTTITGLGLGASLDPSSPLFQSTSKVGFDLTIPTGKDEKESDAHKFRHRRCNVKDMGPINF